MCCDAVPWKGWMCRAGKGWMNSVRERGMYVFCVFAVFLRCCPRIVRLRVCDEGVVMCSKLKRVVYEEC